MNRSSLLVLLLLSGFTQCKNNGAAVEDKNKDKETITVNTVVKNIQLLGSYVGNFGDNKVTLLISKVLGDSIAGRTIVGGNDRPFAGILSQNKDVYTVTAKEPGDNEYDGVFNFTFNATQPGLLTGSWVPNKSTPALKEKTYALQRREFVYQPAAGTYPEASQRLLKEADVENKAKHELESMRNEIFARHGYCFQRKASRQQFEVEAWYVPNSTDIKKDLTEIEKKNIALIKKYEKYAEEYGDDFGR